MLQMVKETYWSLRGPIAENARYRKLQRQFSQGASETEFDIDWVAKGYNRISVINRVLAAYKEPVKYLEIGCATNQCFNCIPVPGKVGVDPERGGTHRMTSDAFFEQNNQQFDVIFIDGLHEFHQCRKDAINALSRLPVGGTMLFHDFLPRNWREEHVPRISRKWTGDVWKVAVELMASSGIDFRILEVDNGVGVVRKLSEDAKYQEEYDRVAALTFQDYCGLRETMPIYQFEECFDWLAGR